MNQPRPGRQHFARTLRGQQLVRRNQRSLWNLQAQPDEDHGEDESSGGKGPTALCSVLIKRCFDLLHSGAIHYDAMPLRWSYHFQTLEAINIVLLTQLQS